jgi:hypothetical protein
MSQGAARFIAMTPSEHFAESNLKPEQRAKKYRSIAAEIRAISGSVIVDDVRASLLNLAFAYERLADSAELDFLEPLSAGDGTPPLAR